MKVVFCVAGLGLAVALGGVAVANAASTGRSEMPAARSVSETAIAEQNKAIVRDFYDMAFNDHKPREAAAKYIGDTYIQHNPFVPNGAAPFYEHFEVYFRDHPQSHVVFSHILAEGDLVVLHLHSRADPGDLGKATVDIFRVADGKIVEHWDVTQDVPATTVSGNTMF